MAGPPKKAKRTYSRRAPPPHQQLDLNVGLQGRATRFFDGWKPVALGITICGGAIIMLYQFYNWTRERVVVRTDLNEAFEVFGAKVDTKLGTTKNEVIEFTTKSTNQVQDAVKQLSKSLETVSKDTRENRMATLDARISTKRTEKERVQSEIAMAEKQSDVPGADQQYWKNRKINLTEWIKNIDREIDSAVEQLRKAQRGE